MDFLGFDISQLRPPLFVAELSASHEGSLDTAYKLMEAAKNAGADAIKVQTIIPEEITLNCDGPDFMCRGTPWEGTKLYDLYNQEGEAHKRPDKLFEFGRQLGIPVFSSVYGPVGLGILEDLDCPAYKISSFENNWTELIARVRDTGKPLMLSLGVMQPSEFFPIEDTIDHENTILTHCVSAYPCPLDCARLNRLAWLRDRCGTSPIGFSDHTLGTRAAEYAVVLSANVIEKHIGFGSGLDSEFAATPYVFKNMVDRCREAYESLYTATYPELASRQFKRSIYVTRAIGIGDKFTAENIQVVRPSFGLSPDRYGDIVGKTATQAIEANTALTEDMVKWTT